MTTNMNMLRTKQDEGNMTGSGNECPAGHAITETCIVCGEKHNNRPNTYCNRARQLYFAHVQAIEEDRYINFLRLSKENWKRKAL